MNTNKLVLCAAAEDDLSAALQSGGYPVVRETSLEKALETVPQGGTVFVAAEAYPQQTTVVTAAMLEAAAARGVHLVIEYPKQVGDTVYPAPVEVTQFERVAALSPERLGVPRGTLLTLNCNFLLPLSAPAEPWCVGRMAGYDTMAYGLPEKVWPLFEEKDGVTVTAAPLSRLIRARSAPLKTWHTVCSRLLSDWCGQEVSVRWNSPVHPCYAPEEPLPPVPVQLGAQGTVQPRVDPAEGLLLAEKSRLQGLEQTVTLPESAEAPVRQGDVLGMLTVTQNGETVLEVPIRAAETVEKLTFGQMLLRLARTMCFCG